MNQIVTFKGNSAKRHACAGSNICRMAHPITDCSLASDQKNMSKLNRILYAALAILV
jgi:hypothetical protein